MGGTVFHYPDSYSELAKEIRSALAPASQTADVLVGVLLNHAYLPGVLNRGPDESGPAPLPASPMGGWSGGWGPLKAFGEWPGADKIKAALPLTHELITKHIDFMVGCVIVDRLWPGGVWLMRRTGFS